MHFLANYISAIRGCCALKFLHTLQIDQTLLAHANWEGVPQKHFNRENLKKWLKIHRVSPYNFRDSGNILIKPFPDDVPRVRDDKMGISLGRPAP